MVSAWHVAENLSLTSNRTGLTVDEIRKMTKRNENRPGYKKTKVGWIPEEWDCVKLKKISSINPETLSDKTDKDYRFHYIDLSAVNEGKLKFPDIKISLRKAPSRARRKIKKDDVLLATVRPNLKGFCYIDFQAKDLVCSTGYAVIRSTTASISRYLFYNLFSYETERYFYGCVVGSNYPALNNSDVDNLKIPLPPLPEQKKIAEILSAWDRAIEQVGRLIDAKERLKKGLMQKLLTGRIRFLEFGKPARGKGRLPEGWKVMRAKKIFKRYSVKNRGNETVLSVTQDVGVVPRDSLDRKINMTDSNTNTYKLVEPGDFVISLRSFQGGIEYSKYRGVVSPAYHVIRSTVKVDKNFYRYFFKSYEFVGHLAIAVIGIRDGKQVSYDDFAYMRLPYPPVPEQTRIAAVLSACDREIELLKKKQEQLKKQKKGLMQKLLTGEVRVNLLESKNG